MDREGDELKGSMPFFPGLIQQALHFFRSGPPSVSDERGAGLLQVMMVSVFVMLTAYALFQYLDYADANSRRIIDRTVYLDLGSQASDDVATPDRVKSTESVSTEAAYD